ncbi:MAG TPA: PQQ-dependent sugar dehydrogenase [Rhizomicrobium sp.]|nr:PQQ-dependent sugar dehydrogenase [Rhizomicrobium sp.]
MPLDTGTTYAIRPLVWSLLAFLMVPVPVAHAAPGDHFVLLPKDLPPPNSTKPTDFDPDFMDRPANAMPQVPQGFEISLFASHLQHPRSLAVAPDGDVYVVGEGPGIVFRLRDSDGDGKADEVREFAKGFKTPHGIALQDGQIYIGDTNAVWRAPYQGRDNVPASEFQRVTKAPDLRPQGWHATRDIVFDSTGMLYLAVGARDDLSEQPLPDASIERIGADGEMTPFATGLRNVEGLAFFPGTDDLWVTVNERDKLGARTPSDFLAQARNGDFFGWPYAYNGPNPDPVFGANRPDLVAKTKVPEVLLGAHTAPLGLVFYTGTQFPADYRNDAFVAIHGSGPYDTLDGYKVVRVRFKNGKPLGGYEDFITGFATVGGGHAHVWGTPSQLAVAHDGSLLLVDDKGGCIWRVSVKK